MQWQKKLFGSDRVLTIAMLCNSDNKDLEDAKLVADTFNVRFLITDLSDSFELLKKEINTKLETHELNYEAQINMKPRLRMINLYAIAQTLGYLVIGTGNLSESMVRIYNKMGR